jgi:hypothetical protein
MFSFNLGEACARGGHGQCSAALTVKRDKSGRESGANGTSSMRLKREARAALALAAL